MTDDKSEAIIAAIDRLTAAMNALVQVLEAKDKDDGEGWKRGT